MSLPLLPAIRKKYPSAYITWVSGKRGASLLHATKLVDHVIEIDEERLFKGNLFVKIRELIKVWKILFGKRFGSILLLHRDPRYRLLSCFTFRTVWRALGKRNKRSYPIPGRYHVYEYLSLLEEQEGPLELSYAFPKLSVSLESLLQTRLDLLKKDPLIVIIPGGAKNSLADDPIRRWPINHYVDLVRMFNTRSVRPLLVGSQEDHWVLPFFASLSFENWVGKLDLLNLVALLEQVQLLITHDTGPLHLAKLTSCPVLAIFGPTNPSEKVSSKEKIDVLWGGEGLACRPCYDGKRYADCQNPLCLKEITPDKVFKKALFLLKLSL